MINKLFTNKRVLLLVTGIAVCFLILSRFILLDTSARFVWDESDDLARMSQMYHRNPITLIGPMNANKTFVQSSLTYYMLMPGAALTNFHPMGLVYMTALYGCLLVILLAYILKRFFGWRFPVAILFLTVLFPFVQTGRWAWNPHFIPLWQTIALFIFLWNEKKKKIFPWFFVGLIFTLAFHNHWYAIFSTAGLSLGLFFYLVPKKRIKEYVFYILGCIGAVMPLLIFDLLHPPGLFITRALFFSPLSPQNGAFNIASIPVKLINFPIEFMMYFVQSRQIAIVFLVVLLVYIVWVLRQKTTTGFKKLLLLPITTQIIGLTFIRGAVFDYYYLSAVVPFILFIAIPDKNKQLNIGRILIIVSLCILSLLPSWSEFRKDTWMTNIGRKMKIYQIIKDNLPTDKKCNVFVPASDSGDAVGKIYRDLLIAREDIWLFSKEEYTNYMCIFIVSTAPISKIQHDPAYELDRIRKIVPKKTWNVAGESPWRVHYFEIEDIKK